MFLSDLNCEKNNMLSKFDLYDILSAFIPGALLTASLPILFPQLGLFFNHVSYPESFAVVVLLALAFFLGQLVQALGSLLEPLLFCSWGGSPSDVALSDGLKGYFPKDSAERISAKLTTAVGPNATSHSLFLYAMQISVKAQSGRASRFNGLYAYHRSLLAGVLVMLALAALATMRGLLASSDCLSKTIIFCLLVALLGILWYRTKQRASYYVREVLLSAERVIDSEATGTTT